MPKIVRFSELGGPDVLRIEDVDVVEAGPGEVRIKVHALGLNRAESMFRTGAYIEEPDLPSGLGLEAAGVVESLGSNVKGLAIGQRVALIPPISMKRWPLHGELINYPADSVVPIPESQSFQNAAATWMAYLTAYGALLDLASVKAFEHVVITAPSSSVGLAAIQLVNVAGAVPIAVTTSAGKRDALLAAGAAHVIVAGQDDIVGTILKLTGDRGARVTFDAVGGKLVPLLLAGAAPGGIIINHGALDVDETVLPPAALLAKSLTLRGYLVHELLRSPSALSNAKEIILKGLSSGELKPTIARTFALEEINAAYRYLESNEQLGKVVVTV